MIAKEADALLVAFRVGAGSRMLSIAALHLLNPKMKFTAPMRLRSIFGYFPSPLAPFPLLKFWTLRFFSNGVYFTISATQTLASPSSLCMAHPITDCFAPGGIPVMKPGHRSFESTVKLAFTKD